MNNEFEMSIKMKTQEVLLYRSLEKFAASLEKAFELGRRAAEMIMSWYAKTININYVL